MKNVSSSKKNLAARPIGVFDSGIGGLTVVKALKKVLPAEDIIYFGDTARVPYGSKSASTIVQFALQDAQFLYDRNVKLIIVACHSVSSVALDQLQNKFPIPVIGVIEPGAKAAVMATKNMKIGVIGTQATILSGAYEKAIHTINQKVEIIARPTPLFVPLVEEGWLASPVTDQVAKTYLAPMLHEKIDTLLLGCTHYPLLKYTIQKVFGNKIKIVDASLETAREAKKIIQKKELANHRKKNSSCRFYLSDLTPNFTETARRFLKTSLGEVYRTSLSQ